MAVEAGRMHQARWQGIDVGVVDTAGIVGWQCLLMGITQGPGLGSGTRPMEVAWMLAGRGCREGVGMSLAALWRGGQEEASEGMVAEKAWAGLSSGR